MEGLFPVVVALQELKTMSTLDRRTFLTSTATHAAATVAVGMTTATLMAERTVAADAAVPEEREFYELRRYHLRRGPKQKVFDDYLREAWMPAMGRAGIGPIGVFHVMVGPESPSVYVLAPYRSLDQFAAVPARLKADPEYAKAAGPARSAPASDPVYLGVESWLLRSIASVPRLEVPAALQAGKSRVFELRTYQSHNKGANGKKIEMFDVGETALFRRAGLAPVFFGEALVGSRLPNLTYMLVFDDLAARDQAWRTFAGDPEWKKLSSTPGFTDPEIVTDISNVLLRPAPYSQL